MRRSRVSFVLVVAALTAVGCSSSSKSNAAPKPSASGTSKPSSSAKPSTTAVDGTIVFRRTSTIQRGANSVIVVARLDGSHEKVLTDPGPTGSDEYPRWTPDGKLIGFSRTVPAKGLNCGLDCSLAAAFTVKPTGGPVTQLTHGPAGVLCGIANIRNCDADPAWAPDGKHYSYDREAATAAGGGSHTDIWVANADGTGAHPITNSLQPQQDVNPVWSPDGRTLAFARQISIDGKLTASQIYTVNADGTGLRKLTPNNIMLGFPNWSPDGVKILAVSNPGCELETTGYLYTVHPDGTALTKLTPGTKFQYCGADYSPDGKYIIAAAVPGGSINGQAQLYLSTPNGAPLRVVDPDPSEWQSEPNWEPGS